jgi:hypothetical protein
VGLGGGERSAVVSRWWERWMPEVGWVDLDVREKKDRGGGRKDGEKGCTAAGKWGRGGGKL